MALKPNHPVPEIDLPLAGGGRFRLSKSQPSSFTLVVFYRGLHCPICKGYLGELQKRLDELASLGVASVAISSDAAARAERSKIDWGLDRLNLAYDMPISLGQKWGLYVSKAISDKEPAEFLEPGLFLIRPDQTLYAASVQTMPFTRPNLSEIVGAIRFINEKGYPARGGD